MNGIEILQWSIVGISLIVSVAALLNSMLGWREALKAHDSNIEIAKRNVEIANRNVKIAERNAELLDKTIAALNRVSVSPKKKED